MYNLKSNNRLSGFLKPITNNICQEQFIRDNTQYISNQTPANDGILIYKHKIEIDYSDMICNNINFSEFEIVKDILFSDGTKTVLYRNIRTGIYYINVGTTRPNLVKYVKDLQPPKSETPPTQSNDPDCPCECEKQVVSEQIYINPVRTDASDTPIKVKVQKRVCTSKDNEKKYIFDCNTSIEEINRQLNSGLNGLADCPCDCIDQLVEQTYYISSKPMAGSIPFTVQTEKIVCNDTNEILNKKVDCEELKASLRARGYTSLADRFDCMLSNQGLQDAISDDNIFTKNDYLIPKITATFLGIFAISKYLMK
jgi:hypothetical protein